MSVEPSSLDVLRSPLFTVAPTAEPLSLAALLARLLRGPEMDGFPPQVAPEQRSYWWRFLVRCAAKALHELGLSVAATDAVAPDALAANIEQVLAGLVPEGGWLLYQPDPAKAGFLQVSTPDGRPPDGASSNYKPKPISALTGALGEKNHERKADAVRALTPEETVYALIEYQTAAIYGGAGNYGSQLMGSASGAGSGTPFMGARLAGSNLETFRHDVQTLLDAWPAMVESGLAGDVWALWAEPWSGEDSLPSTQLDPAFIPLARMIRLSPPGDGRFRELLFLGSKGKRVADHTATPVGKDAKGGGLLGDPFTPSVRDPQPKVRGTLSSGYSYTEVVNLLFGDDKFDGPSPSVKALVAREELHRDDLAVVFEGVAYSQGKTEGFYRREVLLPAQGGIAWLDDPAPVRVAHRALLEQVAEAKKALRGALRVLLTGSPKPKDNDRAKTDRPAALLDQQVDAVYLDHLFAAARAHEAGDPQFTAAWARWLTEACWQVWPQARAAVPVKASQRLERELRAEGYLAHKLAALRGEQPAEADQEEPDDE